MNRFSPFEESLWYASAEPAPDLAALEGEITADVCVVGGGYSGLSTALRLREAGVDVVLLEAEEMGFGGSGRNAGHCTPTFHHHSIDGVRALLGRRAEKFIQLQTNAADRVAALVRDHQIRCEWVQNGYFMAAPTPKALKRLEDKVTSYNGVGQSTRIIDRDEAERLTGMRRQYGGWLHPQGGHLNPLGYSRGLARAAVAAGARLFVRSPAGQPERRDGKWRVPTPAGAVTAERLVMATGAYSRDGWKGVDRTFRIMRVFVAATEPLGEAAAAALPENMTAHDGRGDIFVYKRDAAGRIVASMFPHGRRGRDLAYTHQVMTDRLRWQHPDLPADILWGHFWTGELDMQRQTIPRLYGLGPGAVAVTGLSGRGVPTGTILGDVLSEWALGVPDADLALPVEPLAEAPFYMGFAPQLSLRWAALRDNWSARFQGAPNPPHS